MLNVRYNYSDTVEVKSVESGQSTTAEILDFKPKNSLSVSINRQIKLILRYNQTKNQYFGKTGTMEFVSDGPTRTAIAQGRRG
jgi:plasmid maintenance system killer protein